MSWFYALNGQQSGPVPEADFEQMIAAGTLRADTLVWKEGMPSWQPLSSLRPVATGPAGAAWAAPVSGVQYGGFWIRFLARILDGLILAVITTIIRVPLGIGFIGMPFGRRAGGETLEGALAMVPLFGISILISVVAGALYEGFFLSSRGATPGKMMLGLRVIRADGGPISFGLGVGRHFASWLSGAILLIGYIMAAFDSEKRALHDHICGTRVVRG